MSSIGSENSAIRQNEGFCIVGERGELNPQEQRVLEQTELKASATATKAREIARNHLMDFKSFSFDLGAKLRLNDTIVDRDRYMLTNKIRSTKQWMIENAPFVGENDPTFKELNLAIASVIQDIRTLDSKEQAAKIKRQAVKSILELGTLKDELASKLRHHIPLKPGDKAAFQKKINNASTWIETSRGLIGEISEFDQLTRIINHIDRQLNQQFAWQQLNDDPSCVIL